MNKPISEKKLTGQIDVSCQRCDFLPFCFSLGGLNVTRHITLEKNEILFHAQSPFKYLYAVEKGAIKTVQTECDGSELIRNFYFSGEVLGYKAIYSGQYQSTAFALCETNICVIDYSDFISFLQSNPSVQEHMMQITSFQVNMGSYLVSNSADRRVAAFLLDLSLRLNRPQQKCELQLPMSRQDIGSYLRLSAETISRISTKFIQHHLIKIDNKKIVLLDQEKLQEIAAGCHCI
jgi:CRP/FNR family transcriptional regulator